MRALKELVRSHMTKLPLSNCNGHGRYGNADEHTTAGTGGAWDSVYCWIGDRAGTRGPNSFVAISGGKRASATENGARMVLLQENKKLPGDVGGVERGWH